MKKKKPGRLPKSRPIELGPRMTIAQSVELHRTLIAAIASGEPLRIDGSQVEEIDTAILQLLSSAWIAAAHRGMVREWQGTSAALRNSATLIGVSAILQFDRAA